MSLTKLPIVGRIIKNFDSDILDYGLQPATAKLIKSSGSSLIIEKNKLAKRVLKKHTTIVVANHPAEADVLVLLSALEKRKDLNLIINSSFLNISPHLDKHLIPVHILNRLFDKRGAKIKLKLFAKLHKLTVYGKEEEHQKNIESINLAIDKLNKGELVVIFPGGGGEKGKWFSGVGYLIDGVKEKNNAFIVKSYIEGTSNKDYLRIIPGLSKILPDFKVTFDQPESLSKFKSYNPKSTTAELENEYNNWTKELDNQYQPIRSGVAFGYPQRGIVLIRSLIFWFSTKFS